MTALTWTLLGFWLLTLLLASYEIFRLQRFQSQMFAEANLMNLRWRLVAEINALKAIRGAATGELSWSPQDQKLLRAKLQTLKDTGIDLEAIGVEDEPAPAPKSIELN